MERGKMAFKVILQKGLFSEEVMVNFEQFWSEPSEGYMGVHHLELHGNATSETGYRSHFLNVDELGDMPIENYIRGLVSELSGLSVESIERLS